MAYSIILRITKRNLFYVGIILVLALILRVYRLHESSVWFDEYVFIGNAKYCGLTDYLKFLYINFPDYGISPLSAILLYYWINLFPETDWVWRLLPISVGILTIMLTYLFIRDSKGESIAFLTCMIFSISPFNIWFHQELKCYAFLQFTSIASLIALYKYIQLENKNSRMWLSLGFIFNATMPWFHVVYVITPLLQIIILNLAFYRVNFTKKLIWSIISIISILPWVFWFLYLSPLLLNTMDEPYSSLDISVLLKRLFAVDSVGLSEELIPTWKLNKVVFDSLLLELIVNHIDLLDVVIIIFLGGGVLYFSLKVISELIRRGFCNDINSDLFIFVSFFIPMICFFILELVVRKPIFHPLYFFYVLPMLYLMTSFLLLQLKGKLAYLLSIFLIVLYLFQCFSLISFTNRTDYKRVTEFIETNAGINDYIIGSRISTFWDVTKIYMKRDDLKYGSFYSLYGAYDDIIKELGKNTRNRVWLILEPFTVSIIYDRNPAEILTKCLNQNGIDINWRLFPGHYNLYVGMATKMGFNFTKQECETLYKFDVIGYESILGELNLKPINQQDYDRYLHLIKKYISFWPTLPWTNTVLISDIIKNGHLDLAQYMCDFNLKKFPNYSDMYLLKYVICYIKKDNNKPESCADYLENGNSLLRDTIISIIRDFERRDSLRRKLKNNYYSASKQFCERCYFSFDNIIRLKYMKKR